MNESTVRVMVDGALLTDRRLVSADAIERGVVLLLADRVALLLHSMEVLVGEGPRYGLVGDSAATHDLRRQITRVADLDVSVLLRGETGTGKELVAQAIHRASGRRGKRFVGLNMGAVPPTLAASELFGSVKGAFTGADRERPGYFLQADGGTLFLDEVGETPGEIQALLLRALETGEVQAVGAASPRRVDVRVLAATDADLESAIEDGRFRSPLLHRLTGYEISLPPLRQRRDDIGRLLVHFLRQELEALGETWRLDKKTESRPWLGALLVSRLALYPWPGNVRQLRNVARQLVIANRGAGHLRLTDRLDELLQAPRDLARDSARLAEEGTEPNQQKVPAPESVHPIPAEDDSGRFTLRTLLALRWSPAPGELEEPERPAISPLARARLDRLVRSLSIEYDGHEVGHGEGLLLLFERPIDALGCAMEVQLSLFEQARDMGFQIEPRIGIQLGEVLLRQGDQGATGRGAKALEVAGTAREEVLRLAQLAGKGQTLLTRSAYELARQATTDDHPLADPMVRWVEHGSFTPPGAGHSIELFEVGLEGIAPFEAPLSADSAPQRPTIARPRYRSPGEIDEASLLHALRQNDFRLLPTAKTLGISRASLYVLIDRSPGVRKAADLGYEEIEACRERHDGDRKAMARELEVSRKGLSRRMKELGFLND